MKSKPNLTYAQFLQKFKETKQPKILTSKEQKLNKKQLNSHRSNLQTQYTPQKKYQNHKQQLLQCASTMNVKFNQKNNSKKNKMENICLTQRLGPLPSECIQKINKKNLHQKENYQEQLSKDFKVIKKSNTLKNFHNISQANNQKVRQKQANSSKHNQSISMKNPKNNVSSNKTMQNQKNNILMKRRTNFVQKLQNQRNVNKFYNFSGENKGQFYQRNASYFEEQLSQTNRDKSFSHLTQKSVQCIYNKFITQIKEILTSITKIQQTKQLLNHKVSYIQYLQTLKEMKMIQKDYQPYGPKNYSVNQVDLVRQLWEEMICSHNINHFIIVLGIILKIGTPHYMENCVHLQSKYQSFKYTKLQLSKPKIYTQKDSINFHNYPFKPYVSKRSEQLASRSKSRQKKYKIQKPQNQNCNISFNQRENSSFNTQFDCTYGYNQKSICSPTHNTKHSLSPLGNKRSQILYNNAKQKSRQKRFDKSTVDYQYQKNKTQLTFKPKVVLKRKNNNSSQINELKIVSGEQKCINRIIKGRIQKQVKQITIQKGLPYNQKTIQKMIKHKYNELILAKNQVKSCDDQSLSCRLDIFKNNNTSWNQTSLQQKSKTKIQQSKQKQMSSLFQQFNNSNQFQKFSQSPIFKSPINQNKHVQKSNKNSHQKQTKSHHFTNDQNHLQHQKMEHLPKNQIYHHNQCQYQNQKKINTLQAQPISDFDKNQHIFQDFLYLDIYLQEDRYQKLLIKKDSTIQQLNFAAEQFIIKHSLSVQMQQKLKESLMRALKFHNLQKIQQGDEYQEDTSELQIDRQVNDTFQQACEHISTSNQCINQEEEV